MGVERLQLLFRSCNASGLLPFRMVLDAQTKRFKRFENQWCHPTNWWFLIVLIGQSFFVYFIIDYLRWIIFEEFESKLTVFSAIFILGMLNYVVLCLSLRLFLFRFRHLENAMEIFHKVDRLLTKSFRAAPCHARQRTFIGLTLNFIGVIFYFSFSNCRVYLHSDIIFDVIIDCWFKFGSDSSIIKYDGPNWSYWYSCATGRVIYYIISVW